MMLDAVSPVSFVSHCILLCGNGEKVGDFEQKSGMNVLKRSLELPC